jgi:CubicO group peptidase (beta-lactamase class C family)
LLGTASIAQDKSGKINYAKAIGTESLREGAKRMELDSTLYLASMSKLVTSIAALQSVERGHFTLDEDVITRILAEFKRIKILKGFDEETGEPVAVPANNSITLHCIKILDITKQDTDIIAHVIFFPTPVEYDQ